MKPRLSLPACIESFEKDKIVSKADSVHQMFQPTALHPASRQEVRLSARRGEPSLWAVLNDPRPSVASRQASGFHQTERGVMRLALSLLLSHLETSPGTHLCLLSLTLGCSRRRDGRKESRREPALPRAAIPRGDTEPRSRCPRPHVHCHGGQPTPRGIAEPPPAMPEPRGPGPAPFPAPDEGAVSWRAPERRSWGCVYGALTPHLRVAGTVTVCSQ